MAAGASMLPFKSTSQAVMAALKPEYYPPALTGLRGSHPGSNEHAHSQALTKKNRLGTNHRSERGIRPGCSRRRPQWTLSRLFLSTKARKRQEGADTGQS